MPSNISKKYLYQAIWHPTTADWILCQHHCQYITSCTENQRSRDKRVEVKKYSKLLQQQ